MSSPSLSIPVADNLEVAHLPMPSRDSGLGKLMFFIALAFATWQVFTAAYAPFTTQVLRAIHVSFLMLMVFGLSACAPTRSPIVKIMDWLMAIVAFGTGIYQMVFEVELVSRAGDPSTGDLILGVLTILLVFEAARRMMGWVLPTLCAIFALYALFGHYLPSPLNHRPFHYSQVIDHYGLGVEGIFGTPTYVSATYIFLFIVFSSFLERAGVIRLFSDVSLGLLGGAKGGPAKVAVISSALMGMISGSGVANVMAVGPVVIPVMKKTGFSSEFSGGVTATACMGGQIMPPVMGAVAFIMAETLNVSYATVVRAALIPAILYFAAAFWMVHLEASRLNLAGIPKDELPDWKSSLKTRWYLVLPLLALIYLLFVGYTPLFSGTISLAATAILLMGLPLAAKLGNTAFRVVFWVILGGAAGSFFTYGANAVFVTLGILALILIVMRDGRQTLHTIIEALAEGARNALPVGIACAIVGIIVGTLTLTGVASTFTRTIVALGEHSLFLSLLLTMISCLILGMGIPTIPNYIITSTMVASALKGLGVPLIVSHMFVFYFGIMADLTPPVALAAFAAAPIAKTSGLKVGMQAIRVAVAGFVVPFMAVYAPELMLQPGGPLTQSLGFPLAVAYITTKACLCIGIWGAASVGYFMRPLALWERLWATIAAFFLVSTLPYTDEIGWGLTAAFILYLKFSSKGNKPLPMAG